MDSIILIVILILSVVFHEYSHGLMAHQLGDDTAEKAGRLTLNPIPHIDPIGSVALPLMLYLLQAPFLFGWAKPVPYNPYNLKNVRWGGAAVAAAGPASNFLLAVFAALCIRFMNSTAFLVFGLPESFVLGLFNFFQIVVIVNIILGIFNLVPIPPLDGSKLLSAILPESGRRVMNALESMGPIFVFVILIFVFRATGPYWANLIQKIYGFLIGA